MPQQEGRLALVTHCGFPNQFIQQERERIMAAKKRGVQQGVAGQRGARTVRERTPVVLTKFETHPGPVIRTRSNWVTPELLGALEATAKNDNHVVIDFGSDSAQTARLTIAAAAKRRGYVAHSTLAGTRKLAVSFERAEG